MRLFGNRESGHAYKVRLMLNVAGVPHEYVEIDIFGPREARPAEFQAAARFGEVPTLVHDGQAYVQSNAILCHLAEHLKAFGGESRERMDRAREWLFWEANRIGISLPHVRYAKRFAPEAYPGGTLDWLQARMASDLAQLDAEFAKHAFILDDQPSIADFAICGYMFWADQAEVSLPTHVQAWLDRLRALPGYIPPWAP